MALGSGGFESVLCSKPLDVLLHRGFLALDRFDQFKLSAAAVEVVRGTMDAEIGVTPQIVREETKAEFEADQFAGESDV